MIRLLNGTYRTVSPEEARAMFLVQVGQMRGTPQQKQFVKRIERIYLNWDNAPQAYKQRYPKGQQVRQVALPILEQVGHN